MILCKNVFILAVTLAGVTFPAMAQDDKAVFAFGGRYHTQHMENILNPLGPFGLTYENNFVIGAGYQQFFLEWPKDVRVGLEGGVAGRFGESGSLETWAGVVARYDGFVLGDKIRIAPSLTLGLSAETNTVGIETLRKQLDGGDPTILFYIGPEISVSTLDNPNFEVFTRVQHRSGAWGRLGGMGDGANATVLGLRWKM
jgi:hypothetical protein